MRTRLLALFLACAANRAFAADWYVDAVHGSNSNSGTLANDAWRTIGHAIASTPQNGTTIHVARGVYDASIGELFPLLLTGTRAILGTEGSAATVVRGPGATVLFTACCSNAADARLEGFTLRNAPTGIRLDIDPDDTFHLRLEDVLIEGIAGEGIDIKTRWIDEVQEDAAAALSMERVRIQGCNGGIKAWQQAYNGWVGITAVDCALVDNAVHGLELFVHGNPGPRSEWYSAMDVSLSRCSVISSGSGIAFDMSGLWVGAYLGVQDSLFQGNAVGARAHFQNTFPTYGEASYERCTLTENTVGLSMSCSDSATAQACIIYDNVDDVTGCLDADSFANCDIGDGDFDGINGNFSLDPDFVSPFAGDYRLRFSSPCIDLLSPVAGEFDLLGVPRALDGDLDTEKRADLGAFEHAPLVLNGEATLGSTLSVELWGPERGAAMLLRADGPPGSGLPTPFGELLLDRATLRLVGLVPTGAHTPGIAPIQIGTDPALVGTSFSLQAVTTSSIAPVGSAYTNAVSRTIVP